MSIDSCGGVDGLIEALRAVEHTPKIAQAP